jgi:hypothetical protein
LLLRVWPHALHVHAEQTTVKIDAALQVAYVHHRMTNAKRYASESFLTGHLKLRDERSAQPTEHDFRESGSPSVARESGETYDSSEMMTVEPPLSTAPINQSGENR